MAGLISTRTTNKLTALQHRILNVNSYEKLDCTLYKDENMNYGLQVSVNPTNSGELLVTSGYAIVGGTLVEFNSLQTVTAPNVNGNYYVVIRTNLSDNSVEIITTQTTETDDLLLGTGTRDYVLGTVDVNSLVFSNYVDQQDYAKGKTYTINKKVDVLFSGTMGTGTVATPDLNDYFLIKIYVNFLGATWVSGEEMPEQQVITWNISETLTETKQRIHSLFASSNLISGLTNTREMIVNTILQASKNELDFSETYMKDLEMSSVGSSVILKQRSGVNITRIEGIKYTIEEV